MVGRYAELQTGGRIGFVCRVLFPAMVACGCGIVGDHDYQRRSVGRLRLEAGVNGLWRLGSGLWTGNVG